VKDDLFKYSTEGKLIGSTERSAESDDWDLVALSWANVSAIGRIIESPERTRLSGKAWKAAEPHH
jgi:hypothetical protein